MERKSYEINGKKFYQEELTLRQDADISRILKGFINPDNPKSFMDIKISDIIDILLGEKALADIILVILKPETPDTVITKDIVMDFPNSLVMRIVEDFFILNKSATSLFPALQKSLDGMNTTPISPHSSANQKPNLSPSSEKLKNRK